PAAATALAERRVMMRSSLVHQFSRWRPADGPEGLISRPAGTGTSRRVPGQKRGYSPVNHPDMGNWTVLSRRQRPCRRSPSADEEIGQSIAEIGQGIAA